MKDLKVKTSLDRGFLDIDLDFNGEKLRLTTQIRSEDLDSLLNDAVQLVTGVLSRRAHRALGHAYPDSK